ncbi:Uncharacterised protein [Clostridium disporicum]|uniref:Uncharacterized protein n=1 Tax=Clostridium disporicum TaxID=84024 RepID=A0A174EA86_9CLOT|nr:Uncharacterised protein [Clostridium disporicum]
MKKKEDSLRSSAQINVEESGGKKTIAALIKKRITKYFVYIVEKALAAMVIRIGSFVVIVVILIVGLRWGIIR